MSRGISVTLQTEVDRRITMPGFLLEILFPGGPARFCSRGDQSVLGSDWVGWDLQIGGLQFQGANSSAGVTIALGNSDMSIGALVLAEGVVGRAVRIWIFYGNAPIDEDTQLVFAGLALSARIPEVGPVTIPASPRAASVLRLPKRYVTKEGGFSILPARGAKITVNGEVYTAEPED